MELADYRKRIDEIDAELVAKLEERMELVREIGELKKQEGIAVEDIGREEALLKKIEELSREEYGGHNRRVFEAILEESKKFQNAVVKEGE